MAVAIYFLDGAETERVFLEGREEPRGDFLQICEGDDKLIVKFDCLLQE